MGKKSNVGSCDPMTSIMRDIVIPDLVSHETTFGKSKRQTLVYLTFLEHDTLCHVLDCVWEGEDH
jgi:hypothetical protein